MAPRPEHDEEGGGVFVVGEHTPLVVGQDVPILVESSSRRQPKLPRIESGSAFVDNLEEEDLKLPYDEVNDEELDKPWPSTYERSIGIISSPLIDPNKVDILTKSPKPGGPSLFVTQLKRRNEYGTPDQICSRAGSSVDDDTNFLHLQKIKSLDFDQRRYITSSDLKEFDIAIKREFLEYKNGKAVDGKDTNKQETKDNNDPKATFSQCVFNMCNTLMGIGMLALPFAIASAGWIGGILALIASACVTWWTCLLIGRVLNGDPRPSHFFADSPFNSKLTPGSSSLARMIPPMTSMPQMAIKSFGTAGNIVLSLVLYFELFSCLCIFLVTIGDHLYTLYPAISRSTHMVIVSMALAFPSVLLKTPRLLSYMSAVGTFSTVAVVLSVVVSAVIEGDVSQQISQDKSSHTHDLWISSGIATSVGLIAFCFSGHAIIPSFYKTMERPQDFEKILSCSYAIVLLSYVAVGVSGYYMFGSAVEDQITISLANGSSVESAMTCLTWLMVLTAFSKSTLYVFPLSLGVEEIIAPFLSSDFAMAVASCIIKMAMIVLALAVALFVPSFGYICALVGVICTMVVSIVFPAAAHLRLFGHALSRTEKFLDVIIIIIGIMVTVVGTACVS